MNLLSTSEITEIMKRWQAQNPQPASELEYKNAFTLLVAVVLSAQATDKSVNIATRPLFEVVDSPEKMLELGARALSGLCDIDILDMHDRKKKDAPSGTAKELGDAMAKAARLSPETDITYHSLRAGDISSTHTVFFTGFGERIEVTHRAYNWECFANGACEAARFMEGKGPGSYTMSDVIAGEMAL